MFLLKTSASALRKRITVEPRYPFEGDDKMRVMKLNGNVIGHLEHTNGNVTSSAISPNFRGMGLGKKMYGEVMREQPTGELHSDKTMSPDSTRVWQSMQSRPNSYSVQENPAGPYTPNRAGQEFRSSLREAPIFQGKINPAALYKKGQEAALRKFAQGDVGMNQTFDDGTSDEPSVDPHGREQTIEDIWDMNQNREYWTSSMPDPAAVNPVLNSAPNGDRTFNQNLNTDTSGQYSEA